MGGSSCLRRGRWLRFGAFVASRLSPFAGRVFLAVISILPALVIGYLSRSALWSLVIWLGPLLILQSAFLVGAHGVAFAIPAVVVLVWTILLMFSGRAEGWVRRATGEPFARLTAIGLPPADRQAYVAYLHQAKFQPDEARDATQLEEPRRTARALRASAQRILAMTPPDERWSHLFASMTSPMLDYADLLEAGKPVDYDQLKRRAGLWARELEELLRQRSWTYRIIAWVPRGSRPDE